jgi:hypothetical protein
MVDTSTTLEIIKKCLHTNQLTYGTKAPSPTKTFWASTSFANHHPIISGGIFEKASDRGSSRYWIRVRFGLKTAG